MKSNKQDIGYYAVIFTSKMTGDWESYRGVADRMEELAKQQPGYLGHESYREKDGSGVTISYWDSLENIKNWKAHWEHREAQELGQKQFYEYYHIRIARVEEDYEFSAQEKQQNQSEPGH